MLKMKGARSLSIYAVCLTYLPLTCEDSVVEPAALVLADGTHRRVLLVRCSRTSASGSGGLCFEGMMMPVTKVLNKSSVVTILEHYCVDGPARSA